MSIYIKGMEMPKRCSPRGCPLFACVAAYNTGMICTVLKQYVVPNQKNPNCPLIEVPDHGRLIDADGDIGVNVTMMQGGKCKVDLIAPTIIPEDREANK